MPKLTLLQITQDILNDLDSDEVNSIDDTIESQQIAQIVKTVYYQLIDGKDWPHLHQLVQLDPPSTTAYPTRMKIPEDVVKIQWVKYNKRKDTDTKDKYLDITYLDTKDFLDYCNNRDSSASNVDTVVDINSGISILIKNDAAPLYYTSFDDEYIYFDSYDSNVDTTLQNSKTQCFGMIHPTFTLDDSFVPDLPIQAFSYLVAEAKATAFVMLKQTSNTKAEQHSLTQKRRISMEKWKLGGGITVPDYGRKRTKNG